MIEIVCPNCQTKGKVPNAASGKKTQCARCAIVFRVPSLDPRPAARKAEPQPEEPLPAREASPSRRDSPPSPRKRRERARLRDDHEEVDHDDEPTDGQSFGKILLGVIALAAAIVTVIALQKIWLKLRNTPSDSNTVAASEADDARASNNSLSNRSPADNRGSRLQSSSAKNSGSSNRAQSAPAKKNGDPVQVFPPPERRLIPPFPQSMNLAENSGFAGPREASSLSRSTTRPLAFSSGSLQPGPWPLAADRVMEAIPAISGPEKRIALPAQGRGVVVFSSTHSRVALFGLDHHRGAQWQVVDLPSGKTLGTLNESNYHGPYVLRSDGKCLLAQARDSRPPKFLVIDIASGGQIGSVSAPDRLDHIEFGPNEKAIIIARDGRLIQLCDWRSDRVETEMEVPEGIRIEATALSHGSRRFFAYSLGQARLEIVDLVEGRIAVSQSLPRDEDGRQCQCQGLAFSVDGQRLAGLFSYHRDRRMVKSWLINGRPDVEHHYGRSQFPEKPPFLKDLGLQWLTDGSGWLVDGQTIVEHDSGQLIWTLPYAGRDQQYPEGPRRIVDSLHIAARTSEQELGVLSLPRDRFLKALRAARGE